MKKILIAALLLSFGFTLANPGIGARDILPEHNELLVQEVVPVVMPNQIHPAVQPQAAQFGFAFWSKAYVATVAGVSGIVALGMIYDIFRTKDNSARALLCFALYPPIALFGLSVNSLMR